MMKLQLGFAGERYIYLPLKVVDQAKHNPLTEGLYIKFVGHFVRAKFHYIDRPKGCGDYILIYCRDGSGWVKIDGREYIVASNTYFIIPPYVSHSYGADNTDPWSIYWMHFNGLNAAQVAVGRQKPIEVAASVDSRIEERLDIFEDIYQTLFTSHDTDYYLYANSCFTHFISTLIYIDIYRQRGWHKSDPLQSEGDQLINRLTHYMNENIDRKFTISDLSQFVNLSPSYLHRIFVKYFGLSPMNYFIRIKMNKACDMLLNSPLKINQIAAKLNYPDSMYFSRIFKQTVGVSPKQFRENR